MIFESLVTTLDSDGQPHMAAMGPVVNDHGDLERFTLRPFEGSRTAANLRRHPAGVLHITDDVHTMARAALGALAIPTLGLRPAVAIDGFVWPAACRWVEFRIDTLLHGSPRLEMAAVALAVGWGRPFGGLNRAMAAVIEAAILASRLHLPGQPEPHAELARLAVIVNKTGSPREQAALAFVDQWITERLSPEPSP